MKKLFQYILMSVAVVAMASCSNELDEALQPMDNGNLQFVVSDFPAFGENPDTRVIGTQDDGKKVWEENDQIIVTLTSKKYGVQSAVLTYNGTSWSTAVSLSYLENETPEVTAIYAPCYDAVGNELQLKEGMQPGMTEYIPAVCSFANDAISISFTDVTRKYSRLRIATLEKTITVTTTDFVPAGATSVATDASYTLTTDDNGNAFLYGSFAVGAKVSVSDGNMEIVNHAFASATVECVSYALDATYPYLTFTASAEQTMTIKTDSYVLDESMQYSVKGGAWTQLTAETPITFGGDYGTLRLRGKSAKGTATSESSNAQVSFGKSNVQVACSGDIRTLVDYEHYTTVSTANARFYYLFYDCTSLTTAPELPATTLAESCYSRMFYNCTSLTTAPELPATTLAKNCYENMFHGCTSLTTAPDELPATTVAESCYSRMFYNCTSLTTAPELTATTLENDCYFQMFYNCTSLTTAPELPATTLNDYCYYQMFYNCTSLITAPELPATTLNDYCYYQMFYNCTSLSTITMLATEVNATNCLNTWVCNVASTGTFTKAKAANLSTGTSGIPKGWTVVNKE